MTSIPPGLRDTHEAQRTFRAMLDALAHPGRPHALPVPEALPPGLCPAGIALLALLDATTTVALPGMDPAVARWLAFHTGVQVVPPAQAMFIYARQGHGARPALATLRHGTPDAPEASATLLLECPSLTQGARLTLTGPGIRTAQAMAPVLDADFVREWQAQATLFPRGVDVFLLCGTEIIGLPRSTAIMEG